MSVILLILKIIGIVLLCILGLIFLILTLVLWVPIRYHGNVVYDKTLSLGAGISWLLKLLQVRFVYKDGGTDLEIRVFGKRIVHRETEAETKEQADAEAPAEDSENAQAESREEKTNAPEEKAENVTDSPQPSQDKPSEDASSGSSAEDTAENADEKAEEKSGKEKKGASVIAKLRHLFIETDRGQRALSHVLKYIGKILRSVLPKKGTGYVHYGFDSPAATGKVLAFICASYPPRKNMIEIRPDFLEPCFDCDAGFEGRIIPGWLLILVLVMVLNRDVIYVIRKFLSKK